LDKYGCFFEIGGKVGDLKSKTMKFRNAKVARRRGPRSPTKSQWGLYWLGRTAFSLLAGVKGA